MTQLSEHFTLEESTFSSTASRLGINNIPDANQHMNLIEAARHLEDVRDILGQPIHIDSWLRIPALNAAVGGDKASAHMDGWAIDFICPEYGSPLEIVRAIVGSGMRFDQLIMEGAANGHTGWCHISFNPAMRHMVLTAVFHPGGKTTYTAGVT